MRYCLFCSLEGERGRRVMSYCLRCARDIALPRAMRRVRVFYFLPHHSTWALMELPIENSYRLSLRMRLPPFT